MNNIYIFRSMFIHWFNNDIIPFKIIFIYMILINYGHWNFMNIRKFNGIYFVVNNILDIIFIFRKKELSK